MQVKKYFLYFLLISLISSCSSTKDTVVIMAPESNDELVDHYDSVSYAWGVNIADFLKGLYYSDLDGGSFLAGFNAYMNNDSAQLTVEQSKELIRLYGLMLQKKEAQRNDSIGQVFLLENAKREDVEITESGLQYEVISDGWGDKPVQQGDRVIVHYQTWLTDGTLVDSSIDRHQPYDYVVGINTVIKAWDEITLKMKEGDTFKIFAPASMAYGEESPAPSIPPGSTLIFEIKILEIKRILKN